MTKPEQITREEWRRLGGFRNPFLFRKAQRRGGWTYFAASLEWAKEAAAEDQILPGDEITDITRKNNPISDRNKKP